MKRWIIVGMAFSLAFTLNACGGKSDEADKVRNQESEFSEERDEERESDESEFPKEQEETEEVQGAEEAPAAKEESLLTGIWDDDGHRVSLVLQEDGRFVLSDEESVANGTWQVENENMILILNEADAVKYGMDETEREEICSYHIEGDEFSMKVGDEEWTFKRAEKASYLPAGE